MFDILPAATRTTQGFGCTDYAGEYYRPDCQPIQRFHAGVDLAADGIHGEPVVATRDGVIVANQDGPHWITLCPEMGGGSTFEPYLGDRAVFLQVEEPGRVVTIGYGHLNGSAVSPGQQVKVGQVLGWVGTHGASCGDHLHVEVRTDGARQGPPWDAVIDPTPYLNYLAAPKEDDMQLILGTTTRAPGDGPDPHGPGAVYLVLAHKTAAGWVPWEKRWISDPGSEAPEQALLGDPVVLDPTTLDRAVEGEPLASGTYVRIGQPELDALAAIRAELDGIHVGSGGAVDLSDVIGRLDGISRHIGVGTA